LERVQKGKEREATRGTEHEKWPEFAPRDQTDVLRATLHKEQQDDARKRAARAQEAAAKASSSPVAASGSVAGYVSTPAGKSAPVGVFQYEQHEIGETFPSSNAEESSKLLKDIKKQGLLQKITIYQGKVLDGWNRYRALQDLDIVEEEHFTTFEGTWEEAKAYVIGQNMLRRHLTDNQRKQIAGDLLAMEEGKKGGRPRKYREIENASAGADELISKDEKAEKLAEQFHVTKEGVESAAKLRKHAPEVADAIKAGEGTVRKAARAVKPQAPKITARITMRPWRKSRKFAAKSFSTPSRKIRSST
jgi:hypothetical protein